jgi:3-hydroxyisobutyrate dehydrogenase-like beta-hydroxyacid dehydrogenase
MLAHDAAAEAVLTIESLERARGGFHANMASVSPECVARLAELFAPEGVGYLASPVLGRPVVAAAGDPAVVAKAHPFFDLVGKRSWPMGEKPEVANLVKVAVNYNIIHASQALGESIALVETGGVGAPAFVELPFETLFGCVVYKGYGNLTADNQYLLQGFSWNWDSRI